MEKKDEEIITEILAGNKEAYGILMKRYNQRLYRIGKGFIRDDSEIEDAMQEAYIKAYISLPKFENRSLFSTWMTRIFINECLQKIKKKKNSVTLEETDKMTQTMNYSDRSNPETESLNRELRKHLEINIARLPEKYRVIFIMREIEKLNVEETASALEISETNVKARLSRAKEMLRTALVTNYPYDRAYEFNLVRCEKVAAFVFSRI